MDGEASDSEVVGSQALTAIILPRVPRVSDATRGILKTALSRTGRHLSASAMVSGSVRCQWPQEFGQELIMHVGASCSKCASTMGNVTANNGHHPHGVGHN